jgi:N-acetylglutamate synthase
MSATISAARVLAIELAAARAWPALHSQGIEGWRVRLSGGGARRANSVLPLAFNGSDLNAAISAVETAYRAQNTRSYFQVSSISQPDGLDAALEARGYTFEEPCLLLAKRLSPAPLSSDVVMSDVPTEAWMSVYGETLDAVRRAAAPAILAAMPQPRAFLLAMRTGVPLSCALAALSPDGIVIVECVATRTAMRRSGGGQVVMAALEAWAAQNGADTAALQVVAGNSAARTLYDGRGYGEVGRYHYRWRDVG